MNISHLIVDAFSSIILSPYFVFLSQFDADVVGCNRNPGTNMIEALDTYNVPSPDRNNLVDRRQNVLLFNSSFDGTRIICTWVTHSLNIIIKKFSKLYSRHKLTTSNSQYSAFFNFYFYRISELASRLPQVTQLLRTSTWIPTSTFCGALEPMTLRQACCLLMVLTFQLLAYSWSTLPIMLS